MGDEDVKKEPETEYFVAELTSEELEGDPGKVQEQISVKRPEQEIKQRENVLLKTPTDRSFEQQATWSPFWDALIDLIALPLIVVGLMLVLIVVVFSYGKIWGIPLVGLLIGYFLNIFLRRFVPKDILFVWLQPYIMYCAYITCRYMFLQAEPSGVKEWCIFAAIEFLVLAATGVPMAESWGIIYILPYAAIWFDVVIADWSGRVYYMIVYMFYAAFAIAAVKVFQMIFHKKETLEEEDYVFWPGAIALLFTVFGVVHPILNKVFVENSPNDFLNELLASDLNGFLKAAGSVIHFFCTSPVMTAIGAVTDAATKVLAQLW